MLFHHYMCFELRVVFLIKGEQPERFGRGNAKQPYCAGHRGYNPTTDHTGSKAIDA